MTERLMFIDIETKSKTSSGFKGDPKKSVFTPSDNSFKFNFFDNSSTSLEEVSSSNNLEVAPQQLSFTGQNPPFAFNFQIPEEDMDTAEKTEPLPTHEEKSPVASSASTEQLNSKKKSKPKKKKAVEMMHEPTGDCQKSEELTAEEQLNRQLDWCIEQLELGLKTQKGTPKQKEEVSRALKTLRSSKAPLVKKRQIMRTMTGDYRKKMEDEKSKQFKLIQSEVASAQVKVASESPKKSVFHRRAEVKTKSADTEGNSERTEAQHARQSNEQSLEKTSDFVFVPSNENFCFNFF